MDVGNCTIVIDVVSNKNAIIVGRKDSGANAAITSDDPEFLKEIIMEILKTSVSLPY